MINDCFDRWSKWRDNIKLSASLMYSYPLCFNGFTANYATWAGRQLETGLKLYFLKSNYSVKPSCVFNVQCYFQGVNSICWPLTMFVQFACNWNRLAYVSRHSINSINYVLTFSQQNRNTLFNRINPNNNHIIITYFERRYSVPRISLSSSTAHFALYPLLGLQ